MGTTNFLLFHFQIAAIEHSSSSPAATSGDAQNKIQQLQQKCDDLQRKLDAIPSSQATGNLFKNSKGEEASDAYMAT